MLPTFSFEQTLWGKGISFVIGVDEVGRGAFAGPVVAGAVALKIPVISLRLDQSLGFFASLRMTVESLGINDSKQLSAKRREILVPEIRNYFHCGIGEASVAEINRHGIVAATHRAMRRAIRKLLCHPEEGNDEGSRRNIGNRTGFFAPLRMTYILVDGNVCPRVSGFSKKNSQAIIKGDGKSISIAAASIVAKVYRDAVMVQLAKKYPVYGWEKNKGYGTLHHRTAITSYGSCPAHRTVFLSSTLQFTA